MQVYVIGKLELRGSKMMFRVIFFMLVVCLNLSAEETAESMVEYRSLQGYIIEAPESWKAEEGTFGTDVIFFAPADGPDDTFRENMNVMVVPLEVPVTREEFYGSSLRGLSHALTDFSLQKGQGTEVGGIPAYQIVYTHRIGDTKAVVEQYLVMSGNRAFIFTFTAAPDSYEKYLPVFNRIIESVRF